ncbi:glycoside hydrolase family 13 protein [Punctularia strigosozonata HHB-11173 SS5]|uniref:Glycoside hydrolase family 13 protein n=1 Tax=Punctularia strigosozonata (strain HHB-11173) TaxID=741275 RepID=R7S5Q4_PUNST|nr:glycoside hydrolase family 13 protein [Punctularia strigosozonata HHB-11173 SS5]EIN04871.1 glycoside hydrolase family 13 protein [Punctularia strigosozonata HHB-11173 SS5]
MPFINWLPQFLRPWPHPALPGMRLAPESSCDNPLMIQCFTWDAKFEGKSWWKHLDDEIPRLKELGVTQLWLPPAHKAMRPEGQGYDAYDLWDLGEFDQKGAIATRWGTKDELLQLSATAKLAGIDLILDAILNHKLGADRCEPCLAVPVDPKNRMRDLAPPREIEAWTIYEFPGRGNQYSAMKWNHAHFTGVDWDQRTKTGGVYRLVSDRHKGWSRNVDNELGNYDYLLGSDIDHRHSEVIQDQEAWGRWVLETTGAQGFRLDAIKHMDRVFLRNFLSRTRDASGKSRMFAVAEYWSANLKLILPYVRAFGGLTSFFDVPLHDNFHQASKRGPSYDLRRIFDKTLVKARPGDAVTFVDNHDTQIGQSLESWVGSNFKLQAYALILLRAEGHPCVFYGDLYPNKECYDPEVAQPLDTLIRARKLYAYGPTRDFFDSPNCIGWVRVGDSTRQGSGCMVVVSNAPPRSQPQILRMNVGDTAGAGPQRTYRALLGSEIPVVTVGADGWAAFSCPPGGVQVWVPEG